MYVQLCILYEIGSVCVLNSVKYNNQRTVHVPFFNPKTLITVTSLRRGLSWSWLLRCRWGLRGSRRRPPLPPPPYGHEDVQGSMGVAHSTRTR